MREFLVRALTSRSYVLDLMVGILMVTTIFFLVGQRNQTAQLEVLARQNKALNSQTLDLGTRIKSCTDPQGECYKASGKRSAEAIANINRVTLFAAYCASKTPPAASVAVVRKCVEAAITGKEPIQTK